MGNRFKTKTKLLAGSLLLLSPALVAAAGLGKLSVLSALGQPLKVEIDVVALHKGESDSLTARIASPDAFRQAGVEYGAVIPQIRAAVERRNDGGAIISLKSQQPIDEPFVDVLVELNSASGRLVRQYTFLLDPVGYKGPQPIVAAPSTVAESQAAPAQPVPQATPIEPAPSAEQAPAATPTPQPALEPAPAPLAATEPAREEVPVKQAETSHEVKRGDTLAKIALAHKPQDVSLQQMLVAIQRANEDAFINSNMNLVRIGKILRIPDAATANQVDQREAVRVVNTQTRQFADYRAKLAETVAAASATDEAGQQQASGRITTQVEEKPATAAPTDELRLSKATEGTGATAAGTATADDVAAREQALREANNRVADLERNLGDLQKLLELKNQQLAELQQQAQPQAGAPVTPSPAPDAVAPTATETAPSTEMSSAPATEAPTSETPAITDAPAETAAANESDVPATPAETTDAATPAAKPVAKPVVTPASPSKAESSFIDTLMEDPLLLAGGGGAVLAMLLGLIIWRRKRSTSLDNSLLGMTTTDSSSVFGTTGGRNVDTGASGLQTDFSQSALGSIDTEEVDPVAEADVYMAYGRDAQAEEILKEALQKDPSRQAVRLKLLEIYASRKDLKAFETTASEIYATSGGQGPDWEKAVALGRSIDPSNAMYGAPQVAAVAQAVNVAPAPVAETPDSASDDAVHMLDLELDSGTASQPAFPDIPLDPNVSQALDLDLDLNLGEPSAAEEPADFSPSGTFIMDAETKKAVSDLSLSQSLDIDLGAPTLEPKDAKKSDAGLAMDFKLDEPKFEQANVEQADVPAVDLSGLSLDLNENPEQGADSSWQEVATKLDLAKAYEEMGDKDGARELLNEVIKEGDNGQQDLARAMLESIR